MASLLRDRGYTVLTFNLRGVCPGGHDGCSRGEESFAGAWMDVLGAARFVGSHADRVVVGGASIGAMASLSVASRFGDRVDGVMSLSGGQDLTGAYELDRQQIQRIRVPQLYVAGTYDSEFGDAAADWLRWANPPVEGRLLDTGLHGTDMLNLASGEDSEIPELVEGLILDFLGEHFPIAS